MAEAIDIIAKVQNEIGVDNSSIGELIKQKLNTIVEKHTGFEITKNISNILEGKSTSRDNRLPEEITKFLEVQNNTGR